MAFYYFDIETYSPGNRPDPVNDKIISIQFRRIDFRDNGSVGDLYILKEWESSEEEIIKEFYDIFTKNVWDFIPVGNSLDFEFTFLQEKFKKYLGVELDCKELYYSRPRLDLKPFLVLLNEGNFKGASLSNFSNKSNDGNIIKYLYEDNRFYDIEKYIEEESQEFINFLFKNYDILRQNKHLF